MINIENELVTWVIDYITNTVHNMKSDNPKFNNWAKKFERAEAETLVGMEYGPDWGYDTRKEITEEEAEKYAQALLKVVLRVNGFPMK